MKTNYHITETKIWKYLNSINSELANNSITFIKSISPLLDSIQDFFPFYTDHGNTHSYQVVTRMAQVIKEECLISGSSIALSETETFLLICSAYAHDVGMAILPDEQDTFLIQLKIKMLDNWKTDQRLQAELRRTHSSRARVFVTEQNSKIGIPPHLTGHLCDLMEAHNYSIAEFRNKLSIRRAAESTELNMQQLASILCIADILEYSETRVKEKVLIKIFDLLEKMDSISLQISLRENLKHVCIGDNVAIAEDGKIIISGSFTNPDVLNLAHQTVDYIERWVNDYVDFNISFPKDRLKVRNGAIFRHFDIKDLDYERLGIRINHKSIIDLISSNALWTGNSMVLKELLQNSIEACRFRKYNSSLADDYKPYIELIFDDDANTITISDNGCGMDRNVILNNFLTVGNSRSREPNYQSNTYSSLARFGIGFWSVFTMASKVQIKTASFIPGVNNDYTEGLRFDVSTEVLKDFTVFKREKMAVGTTLVLDLKNKSNLTYLYDEIANSKRVIICSEIPLLIRYKSNTKQLPLEIEFPTNNEIYGPKLNFALENGFKTFSWESRIEDYSLKLTINYRLDGERVSFHLDDEKVSKYVNEGIQRIPCICGFRVEIRAMFPVYEIVGYSLINYIANSNNPKGFGYSIDRKQLIDTTPEYAEYSNFIFNESLKAYRCFLKEVGAYSAKGIFWLFYESRYSKTPAPPARYWVENDNKGLEKLVSVAGDLFVFHLAKVEKGKTYADCDIEYHSYNDLIQTNYKIFFAEDSMHMYRWGHRDLNSTYHLRDYDKNYALFCNYTNEENVYFSWRNCQLLFDNDPHSYIQLVDYDFEDGKKLLVSFLVVNTNSISPTTEKNNIIGEVISGTNPNWILKRKRIIGGNFAVHSNGFYINYDTQLLYDIENLYKEGKLTDIREIIEKLVSSIFGFISDDIRKYLEYS